MRTRHLVAVSPALLALACQLLATSTPATLSRPVAAPLTVQVEGTAPCRGVGLGERLNGTSIRFKCGATSQWLTSHLDARVTCAFTADGTMKDTALPEVRECYGQRYWGGRHELGEGCGPGQHGRGGLRAGSPLHGYLRALADHPSNPLRLPRPQCPIEDIDDRDCRNLLDSCDNWIIRTYNATFDESIPLVQPPNPQIDPGEPLPFELAEQCVRNEITCVPTQFCDTFPGACLCWEWRGERLLFDPTKSECVPLEVVAAGPSGPEEPEPEPPGPGEPEPPEPEPGPEPEPDACELVRAALQALEAAEASVCPAEAAPGSGAGTPEDP